MQQRPADLFVVDTHSVVEATSDPLAPDPKLPLARLAIPRGALVVPASVAERVVEAVQGLSVHGQRNEAGLWGVGDPRLDLSVFTIHCNSRMTHTD